MVPARVKEIEHALERALARERCSSDDGCSALSNVLLAALVKCRQDPRTASAVSLQMRELAALIVRLAGDDPNTLDATLADNGVTH